MDGLRERAPQYMKRREGGFIPPLTHVPTLANNARGDNDTMAGNVLYVAAALHEKQAHSMRKPPTKLHSLTSRFGSPLPPLLATLKPQLTDGLLEKGKRQERS